MEFNNSQEFLSHITNKKIKVKLTNGVDLEGNFVSVDEQFNVLLTNGVRIQESESVPFKDIFIRGNNIRFLELVN